ncbi:MAG: hypothetical protein KAI79_06665 [Bacteroidales bacterium]|nr:hypothetical protein [Bacteroidales bacterium]
MLIQMEQKELKEYREAIVEEINNRCPICTNTYDKSEFVVDHQHKTKSEEIGKDGAGLIRGVICRYCNSFEGKALGAFVRLGLKNRNADLPELLIQLGKYLKQENTKYIHPNEKPKAPKLGKRIFNRVNKEYKIRNPKKKPLIYPKSGNITKQFNELIKLYNL